MHTTACWHVVHITQPSPTGTLDSASRASFVSGSMAPHLPTASRRLPGFSGERSAYRSPNHYVTLTSNRVRRANVFVAPAQSCAPEQIYCGGQCVEACADPANCGACARACPPGFICVRQPASGICACVCPPGTHSCPSTPHAVCCPDGHTCSGSPALCCPPAHMNCGGECVDVRSDPWHCGGCGITCAADEVCVEGVCNLSPEEACTDACNAAAAECAAAMLFLPPVFILYCIRERSNCLKTCGTREPYPACTPTYCHLADTYLECVGCCHTSVPWTDDDWCVDQCKTTCAGLPGR
jgi:hypothetical protein